MKELKLVQVKKIVGEKTYYNFYLQNEDGSIRVAIKPAFQHNRDFYHLMDLATSYVNEQQD